MGENGKAKPPVEQDWVTTLPEELMERHCPAEPERLVMASEVVVAFVVVAFCAVTFWSVEEPWASKFPTVTRLEKVGVPEKVPESAPPLVALKLPEIVEEPVMAKLEVVPEVSEKARPVRSPVFDMENKVEVAKVEVEDAMEKSVGVL